MDVKDEVVDSLIFKIFQIWPVKALELLLKLEDGWLSLIPCLQDCTFNIFSEKSFF